MYAIETNSLVWYDLNVSVRNIASLHKLQHVAGQVIIANGGEIGDLCLCLNLSEIPSGVEDISGKDQAKRPCVTCRSEFGHALTNRQNAFRTSTVRENRHGAG